MKGGIKLNSTFSNINTSPKSGNRTQSMVAPAKRGFGVSSNRFGSEHTHIIENLTKRYPNLHFIKQENEEVVARKSDNFHLNHTNVNNFVMPQKQTNVHYIIPQYKSNLVQLAQKIQQEEKERLDQTQFSNLRESQYHNNNITGNSAEATQSSMNQNSAGKQQMYFKSLSNNADKRKNATGAGDLSMEMNQEKFQDIWKSLTNNINNSNNNFNTNTSMIKVRDSSFNNLNQSINHQITETPDPVIQFKNNAKKISGHCSAFQATSRQQLLQYQKRTTFGPGPGQYKIDRIFEQQTNNSPGENTTDNSKAEDLMIGQITAKTKFLSPIKRNQSQENEHQFDISRVKKKITGIMKQIGLDDEQDKQTQSNAEKSMMTTVADSRKTFSGGGLYFGKVDRNIVKQSFMFQKDDRDRFGSQIFPISSFKVNHPGPGAYSTNHHSIEQHVDKIQSIQEQKRLLKQWLHPNQNNMSMNSKGPFQDIQENQLEDHELLQIQNSFILQK